MEPGQFVTESIRIVRLLGQGGMGSVWVADHLTLKTQVAVKFMSVEVAAHEDARTRFSREASASAGIKSPHVVQVFDHGITAEGVPYIVMELLDGESLFEKVTRDGPLAVAETAEILGQAAKALSRAHAMGIVHRDIKPENLFLTAADGEIFVKVLDFGIAKQATESDFAVTSTGAVIGTPFFLSPEQCKSAKHVDHRSDLWSLGVVAYQCLTGAVPFHGETFGGICIAIDRGEYQRVTELRPSLPASLNAFFARALAHSPDARFQSAREMADALAKLAGIGAPWREGQPEAGLSASERSAETLRLGSDMAAQETLAATSVTGPRRSTGGRTRLALAGACALIALFSAFAFAVKRRAPHPNAPVVTVASAAAPTAAVPSAVEPPAPSASASAEPDVSAAAPAPAKPSAVKHAPRAPRPTTRPGPIDRGF